MTIEFVIELESPLEFVPQLADRMKSHGFEIESGTSGQKLCFGQTAENSTLSPLTVYLTQLRKRSMVRITTPAPQYPGDSFSRIESRDNEISEWEYFSLARLESLIEGIASPSGIVQVLSENRLNEATFHLTPLHRYSWLSRLKVGPASIETAATWALDNGLRMAADKTSGIVKVEAGEFGDRPVALLNSPFCGGSFPLTASLALEYHWPPDEFSEELIRKCQGPSSEDFITAAEKESVAVLEGASLASLEMSGISSKAAVTRQIVRFHKETKTYSVLRCYDDGLVVPILGLVPR